MKRWSKTYPHQCSATHSNILLQLSCAAGLDHLHNSLPADIDHGDFIRALAADEDALMIGAERQVRRRAADRESCSCFVLMCVDQTDA